MSQELGRMLKRIPAKVRENVRTDHIYLGEGKMRALGCQTVDVEIKVFLFEKRKMASVRVREKTWAAPFETEREQTRFTDEAVRTVLSTMN